MNIHNSCYVYCPNVETHLEPHSFSVNEVQPHVATELAVIAYTAQC